MVNKFVYNGDLQPHRTRCAVRLPRPESLTMRMLRAGLIAAAIGASAVALGFAAQADSAARHR